MEFNPWEIKGEINYDKLIKEFGIEKIPLEELPEEFKKEKLFRRKIIFGHRGLGKIIKALKEGEEITMMTGLMPTGKMHLGHMLVAKQMIFYQQLGAKLYIAVADIEAYHARGQSLEESKKIAIEEYITNYIALGLKPENTEIYFQSDRSKDGKKASAYYRLQNLFSKHITENEIKAVYGEITPGKMMAAMLQAADMIHPQLPEFGKRKNIIVPVGADQDPHMRLTRDLVKRMKEYKLEPMASTYHYFIPGLKGGKMSSSDATSYIALTDNPKEAAKKINKYALSGGQPTIEEHRKLGGNTEKDVSYQYLKYYFEEDDQELERIKQEYESGKMLTGELKKILIEKITKFLEEHQKKREEAKKKIKEYLEE